MHRFIKLASRWFASFALIFSLGYLSMGHAQETPRSPRADQDTPSADQETTEENVAANARDLQALFAKLQDAIRTSDTATAATITRGFFPNDASLQRAVKDATAVEKIKNMHARFSAAPDDQIAKLFATDANRTEIKVHSATTEEIIANDRGSAAYREFPGGAKKIAEAVLQPKMTFYEIELVEPGKERGMKYHLFYHDGKAWKMLGPIWRVLR